MSTFVLIPGAGGAAGYWSRLVPLLRAAGHEAIAVGLPGPDPDSGPAAYAALVAAAIGDRDDAILVAQSLGGFTAPLVCERVAVRAVVLLNAMVPVPGETPDRWPDAVGSEAARLEAADAHGYPRQLDLDSYFLHDLDEQARADVSGDARDESNAAFASACAFTGWPAVPIHVLAGADDRLFPAAFQRRVARERLGVEVELLPGGHLLALSHPAELADRLIAIAAAP